MHPTGSLKHRLARSLFLYGLCNGWIGPRTTVVEASSGSTAVSEAYFARMLGLPFIAVMPASTSPEKIALIEFQGGKCHLVDDPATVVAEARWLADGPRRPLHGPVHLRRAGHRLARQQQHRRVDLRADGARAASRAGLDRRRRRHRRHQRDHRPVRPLPAATRPGSAWSTRRTRRSSRPSRAADWTVRDRPGLPDRGHRPAARWRRRSSRRSSTGWCRCRTPRRSPRCAPASAVLGRRVGGSTGTNLWGAFGLIAEMRAAGGTGLGGDAALRRRRAVRRHVLLRRLGGRGRASTSPRTWPSSTRFLATGEWRG